MLHFATRHEGACGRRGVAPLVLCLSAKYRRAVSLRYRLPLPDKATLSIDSCRVGARIALDPVKTKIPAQTEGQTVLDRRPPDV